MDQTPALHPGDWGSSLVGNQKTMLILFLDYKDLFLVLSSILLGCRPNQAYRSTILLQVDFKLLSNILALRLEKIPPHIINNMTKQGLLLDSGKGVSLLNMTQLSA